jgi:hypothetical protein
MQTRNGRNGKSRNIPIEKKRKREEEGNEGEGGWENVSFNIWGGFAWEQHKHVSRALTGDLPCA